MEIKFNLENKWAKTFATTARGSQQTDERSFSLSFGKSTLVTSLSGVGSDRRVLQLKEITLPFLTLNNFLYGVGDGEHLA